MADGTDELGDETAGIAVGGSSMPTPGAPRGWYPDPWDARQHRFWNGREWTDDAFANGPAGPISGDAISSPGRNLPAVVRSPAAGAALPPPPPDWVHPSSSAVETGAPASPPGPPAAPVPEASPRRAPLRTVLVIAVAALVAFGAAFAIGRSRDGGANPTAQSGTARQPSITTPTTRPAALDPSASVLSGLVLQPADTTSTLNVRLLNGGTQVSGQTTLDLCNGSFPSESLRIGRLQDVAVDSSANAVLSTEAVLYRNAAATTQGFTELKNAAANCRAGPIASPAGGGALTTQFQAAPDGAWPQTPSVDRLAFSFITTDQSGQSRTSIAVYLRRGRVLMGVYFAQPDTAQPAIGGQTTIAGIVNLFAGRIAHLPATVVNG